MVERRPPDGEGSNERLKHLKQASRLIVTSREKMPHSAQWYLSLRRTLWRYTQEVLLQQREPRLTQTEEMEDRNRDH